MLWGWLASSTKNGKMAQMCTTRYPNKPHHGWNQGIWNAFWKHCLVQRPRKFGYSKFGQRNGWQGCPAKNRAFSRRRKQSRIATRNPSVLRKSLCVPRPSSASRSYHCLSSRPVFDQNSTAGEIANTQVRDCFSNFEFPTLWTHANLRMKWSQKCQHMYAYMPGSQAKVASQTTLSRKEFKQVQILTSPRDILGIYL